MPRRPHVRVIICLGEQTCGRMLSHKCEHLTGKAHLSIRKSLSLGMPCARSAETQKVCSKVCRPFSCSATLIICCCADAPSLFTKSTCKTVTPNEDNSTHCRYQHVSNPVVYIAMLLLLILLILMNCYWCCNIAKHSFPPLLSHVCTGGRD